MYAVCLCQQQQLSGWRILLNMGFSLRNQHVCHQRVQLAVVGKLAATVIGFRESSTSTIRVGSVGCLAGYLKLAPADHGNIRVGVQASGTDLETHSAGYVVHGRPLSCELSSPTTWPQSDYAICWRSHSEDFASIILACTGLALQGEIFFRGVMLLCL